MRKRYYFFSSYTSHPSISDGQKTRGHRGKTENVEENLGEYLSDVGIGEELYKCKNDKSYKNDNWNT
jgi:hypothetical protein